MQGCCSSRAAHVAAAGLISLFAIAGASGGCRALRLPDDIASGDAEAPERPASDPQGAGDSAQSSTAGKEPAAPLALVQDAWVLALPKPDAATPPEYRWRHGGLDELTARPAEKRLDFAAFLTHSNPVVAANAAIACARLGDRAQADRLREVVDNTDLKLPLRRAAAEMLAREPTPVARPLLEALLERFGDPAREGTTYVAELHADLLRGAARHVAAGQSRYFADALRSPAADVRVEALAAFAAARQGELPIEAVDLRTDGNPRVRAAVIACLVERRHPQAYDHAKAALSDLHFDVRQAAVAGLGKIGGDEARKTLHRLLLHEPEAVRVAAVAALSAAGDDVAVFGAAQDTAWQVRRNVAAALARYPTPRGTTLARQLLADRSAEVRRAVLEAVDAWPLAQAGPLLLSALEEAPYQSRKQAAEQFARRWPPARQYACDAPPERRIEQLDALRAQWAQAYGAVDRQALAAATTASAPARAPASDAASAQADMLLARLADRNNTSDVQRQLVAQAVALGPSLIEILDRRGGAGRAPLAEAVFREVLPALDPTYEALAQLTSADVATRRAAAKRLADAATDSPLPPLAVNRLADVAAAEPDGLVWREVLRAIRGDSSEPAIRLAYAGSSHPAAEVRRLSCGHLGSCSDPRHAVVLVRSLEDSNSSVVRAAVEALGFPGALADPAPLERLLATGDKPLRVEVARSLARNGAPSGGPALERLARDPDPNIRRQAVTVMGGLGSEEYVGTLVSMLDDDLSIRLASVASLTQIVGRDVTRKAGENALPLADQVQGWKRWWNEQPARQTERHSVERAKAG